MMVPGVEDRPGAEHPVQVAHGEEDQPYAEHKIEGPGERKAEHRGATLRR